MTEIKAQISETENISWGGYGIEEVHKILWFFFFLNLAFLISSCINAGLYLYFLLWL